MPGRARASRTAAVHQQGVVEVRRLIRQRARWFQGNLQSWRLIPLVLRKMSGRDGADLLFLLSSPALVLIGGPLEGEQAGRAGVSHRLYPALVPLAQIGRG